MVGAANQNTKDWRRLPKGEQALLRWIGPRNPASVHREQIRVASVKNLTTTLVSGTLMLLRARMLTLLMHRLLVRLSVL